MKENIKKLIWCGLVIVLIIIVSCSSSPDSSSNKKLKEIQAWIEGDWVAKHGDGLGAFLFVTDKYASVSEGFCNMEYEDYDAVKHSLGHVRYSIHNDSLILRTYKYSRDEGWNEDFFFIKIDPQTKLLYASLFEGDSLQTYRKVTSSEIETWRNERNKMLSRIDTALGVTWPDDFHFDNGYMTSEYGLESGMWRYTMGDESIVFNFMNKFDGDAVSVIRVDANGEVKSENVGKWNQNNNNDEVIDVVLESNDTLRLRYDREHYSMLYDNRLLIYLVEGEDNKVYPNVEIDKEKAKSFFYEFYDRFLNLRSDGSFTIDILKEENGTISGVNQGFINLLTEKWKKTYDTFPTSQDRDPIFELDYAGLWGAKDCLLSKTPKDIIYLGNFGKYNFKVEMDYQDGPHSVLYRLVEDNGTLLIDEATAAY